MINVSVSLDTEDFELNKKLAEELNRKSFASEGVCEGDISIVFGGDETLRILKQEFFKKDEYTDVIAFRLNDYSEKKVEGEIYISLERAKENAESFKEPFEKEVARLIIHGGLHLLDYNDETEKEKQVMRAKENHYLELIGWEGLFNG